MENIHTNIKKFYDIDGVDYDVRRWKKGKVAIFDYNCTKAAIYNYLKNYHFENALEIGCGPGTWTKLLHKFADNITAIDISETMIEIAKKKIPILILNLLMMIL